MKATVVIIHYLHIVKIAEIFQQLETCIHFLNASKISTYDFFLNRDKNCLLEKFIRKCLIYRKKFRTALRT